MNLNTILISAAATSSMINSRQTKKIRESMDSLNSEVAKHAALSSELAAANNRMHDEAEKQTKLLELANSERQLERYAKECIFDLRIQVEEIKSINSSLERLLLGSAVVAEFKQKGIGFQSLSAISDKEFLRNLLAQVDEIINESQTGLTEEERKDLIEISEVKEEVARVAKLRKMFDEVTAEIAYIKNSKDRDLANIFGIKAGFFGLGAKEIQLIREKSSEKIKLLIARFSDLQRSLGSKYIKEHFDAVNDQAFLSAETSLIDELNALSNRYPNLELLTSIDMLPTLKVGVTSLMPAVEKGFGVYLKVAAQVQSGKIKSFTQQFGHSSYDILRFQDGNKALMCEDYSVAQQLKQALSDYFDAELIMITELQ